MQLKQQFILLLAATLNIALLEKASVNQLYKMEHKFISWPLDYLVGSDYCPYQQNYQVTKQQYISIIGLINRATYVYNLTNQ